MHHYVRNLQVHRKDIHIMCVCPMCRMLCKHIRLCHCRLRINVLSIVHGGLAYCINKAQVIRSLGQLFYASFHVLWIGQFPQMGDPNVDPKAFSLILTGSWAPPKRYPSFGEPLYRMPKFIPLNPKALDPKPLNPKPLDPKP